MKGLAIGAVGVLALGLVTVVLYFALLEGLKDGRDQAKGRLSRRDDQLKGLDKDVANIERRRQDTTAALADAKQDVDAASLSDRPSPKLGDRIQKLKRLFPPWAKRRQLIGDVRELGDKADVAVKAVDAGPEQPDGPVVALPLKVRASATYPALMDWLARLTESGGRVVTFSDLQVTRRWEETSPFAKPPPEGPRLDVKLTLTGWFMAEDPGGRAPKLRNRLAEHPRWRAVRGSFWAFSAAGLDDKRDPFSPRFDVLYTKEAEEAAAAANADAGTAAEVPELEKWPLAELRVADVTLDDDGGFAVIVDPKNKHHIVKLDAKLGNKGGVVIDLRKDAVVVDEPESTQPIVLKVAAPEEVQPTEAPNPPTGIMKRLGTRPQGDVPPAKEPKGPTGVLRTIVPKLRGEEPPAEGP